MIKRKISLMSIFVLVLIFGTNLQTLANEERGVLQNVQVHSYDSAEDYMAKMYEAVLDGSKYAIEMGAIYEVQRNLKINQDNLSAKTTNFFGSGLTSEQIKYQIELFLGLIEAEQFISMEVPTGINTAFKSYMDYRTITSRSSMQYQIQQKAYTENGFRKLDNCFLVALGSYYGYCGEKLRITFDSGSSIYAIIGDSKADVHTDSLNRYRPMKSGYGNVVEFIVDSKTLSQTAKKMGDVSHASSELVGNVTRIEKVVSPKA